MLLHQEHRQQNSYVRRYIVVLYSAKFEKASISIICSLLLKGFKNSFKLTRTMYRSTRGDMSIWRFWSSTWKPSMRTRDFIKWVRPKFDWERTDRQNRFHRAHLKLGIMLWTSAEFINISAKVWRLQVVSSCSSASLSTKGLKLVESRRDSSNCGGLAHAWGVVGLLPLM